MRQFSSDFGELFEHDFRAEVTTQKLESFGAEMFRIWFGSSWERISSEVRAGGQRSLVVASDSAPVLNLPWELVQPPDSDFLGFDAKYSIRRLPWADKGKLRPAPERFRPRPLRILFMACSPRGQPELDYEREEELLLKAVSGPHIAFDSVDSGTFDDLRTQINEFQPHIVHLTGHGIVREGLGYFAFEDDAGETDLRSTTDIRRDLFAGSDVQCVFVSGCQTGKAPPIDVLGGVCQGLVGEEVPLAVGWAASIADDLANRFAGVFYSTLATGQSIDRALVQARQAVRTQCADRGDPSWTLPVLYCSSEQQLLCDPDPARPEEPPPHVSSVQQELRGMSEGYAESFIGRRRELQQVLPALGDGRLQSIAITGIGGAGKSTLATRLARRLESRGFRPVAVPSPKDKPLSAATLLDIFGDEFLAVDLKREHQMLADSSLDVRARLHYIVSTLNDKAPFVVVIDNFEENMEEESRKIGNEDVADFLSHLVSNLSGKSRVILTSRYLPSDIEPLPTNSDERSLDEFPESSFVKFLLREPEVERRYHSDELPHDLLLRLHSVFGGTPRFLVQIREVLETIDPDELSTELDAVELPQGAEPSALLDLRDKYCETIFTARLYGYLSAASRKALSAMAVLNIPMSLEGIAAVSGQEIENVQAFVGEWRRYALAYTAGSGVRRAMERLRAAARLAAVAGAAHR